jgi:peptidoglycan/LPS O-acetylase OafA/YrhL
MMLHETSSAHRYAALDGWRGVAALAVAVYHLPLAFPWSGLTAWRNLELAVDFFFVLSGFVIAHAARGGLPTSESAAAFLVRRFFRVWPLHAAVLLLFVLLEAFKLVVSLKVALPLEARPFTGNFGAESIFTNLVFLQAWGLHAGTTWNGPSWSISGEVACYVIFAFATLLLPRRRDAVMAALAVAAFLLLASVSGEGIFLTHDFGVPRAVLGFSVGVLVYRAMGRISLGGTAQELFALLALAVFMVFTGPDWTSLLSPVVFAYVVATHASERGIVSRLLLSCAVQWLGLMSYAIYMVHTLVYQFLRIGLKAGEKLGGIELGRVVLPNRELVSLGSPALLLACAAVAVVGTLALAVLLHRLVERPGIAFGRDVAASVAGTRRERAAASGRSPAKA